MGSRGLCKEVRPGLTLRVHPAAWRRSFRAFAVGGYCDEELDAFLSTAHPGMCLVYVGASYGMFALVALSYPDAQVIAVEPAVRPANVLRRQAVLNGGSGRLRVVEAVAGDRDGLAFMDPGSPECYKEALTPEAGVAVPSVRLDTLVETLALKPTHLKIDVEGDELCVLRGARRVLMVWKPIGHVEIHNEFLAAKGLDPLTVPAFLEELG